jgi:hypothetical protein
LIGDIPLGTDVSVEHPSTLVPLPWVFAAAEDVAEVRSKELPPSKCIYIFCYPN